MSGKQACLSVPAMLGLWLGIARGKRGPSAGAAERSVGPPVSYGPGVRHLRGTFSRPPPKFINLGGNETSSTFSRLLP